MYGTKTQTENERRSELATGNPFSKSAIIALARVITQRLFAGTMDAFIWRRICPVCAFYLLCAFVWLDHSHENILKITTTTSTGPWPGFIRLNPSLKFTLFL